MSNPLWINYREATHGVNTNGYSDVSNRPSRTIWANFTNQHDKDGAHKTGLTDDLCIMETGDYEGTGSDNEVISLVNGDLAIKLLRIWSEESAFFWYATDGLSVILENGSYSSQGYSADNRIKLVSTGSFTLGTSDDVNKSGSTYYYTAYGIDDGGPGGPG